MEKATFLQRYGQWGIVAGASEGLGAAYADQLAGHGLDLLLIARRKEALEALSESLGQKYPIRVKTLPLDLRQPDAAESILRETGGLEAGLLVYNAAYSVIGPFLEGSLDDHIREIDTNMRAPLMLVYTFARQMLERGRGGIVLMSSLSSFQGSAFISTYSATKAFTTVLAEGLWEEWRGRGVDVLACIAGAVRTPGYLASSPRKTRRFADSSLEPHKVVQEALVALGRQPYVIPGRGNRLASFVMRYLMPRQMAIRLMGRVLRGMYAQK